MIFGIGTDMVAVARIRSALERYGDRFAQRVLTNSEWLEYQAASRRERVVAKRFAVKEAAVKALGSGFGNGIFWRDIGTEHDELGRPHLWWTPAVWVRCQAMGVADAFVSVTDENDYALAFVVLTRTPASQTANQI